MQQVALLLPSLLFRIRSEPFHPGGSFTAGGVFLQWNIMAKNWIQGAVKRPGALTRKAKAAGKTVKQFIAHPPKNASALLKQEINFAKTMRKMHANHMAGKSI